MFFSHFFFLPTSNKHVQTLQAWLSKCFETMPAFTAALLRAISPKKVQQAQKAENVSSLKRHSHDPQHLPALLATHSPFASCPPVLGCFGYSVLFAPWLFFFFLILQSSIQLLEPPSLLHPLHFFTMVRRQKLISLGASTMWNLSTTARVWAGVTLAQGNIPGLLQTTDYGGSFSVWSLAMLIVASQRKSLASSGLNTLWASSVVQTQTQMYSKGWGKRWRWYTTVCQWNIPWLDG